MTNYKELLKETNATMGKVGGALPNEMAGFMKLHDAALEDKALDPKAKELIALGISIAIKCEPCIVSHMTALIELGATREEIAETVGVAIFMGGGPSIAYGGKALEAFDQLS
ncbi:MAG: carboxymuconolactone decarboxylase family protein [Clostridiales bacterium]|nr:carboxymuconolactone decarboxylase family protein [Clostridiales bacterium]